MARPARADIVSPEGGFFHVYNRVAGSPLWYPFRRPSVGREWRRRLLYSLVRSHVQAAAFTLMDNHFHLILFVEKFRQLTREELQTMAHARWGRFWKLKTRFWSDPRWERFNRDLFRLDVFMRDFQGPFATWFNKAAGRRGHLWADRYKSTALEDYRAVHESLFYVELNPVRAGLARLPRQWKGSSAYLRWVGRDKFLMSLERLFPGVRKCDLADHYRSRLLYRGTTPSQKSQATIPPHIVRREQARGLNHSGIYLVRMQFLTNGLILGSVDVIRGHLERLHRKGVYKRLRDPTAQLGGFFYSLR